MVEQVFGEAIRNLRLERGMTQERLSDGICSASSLSKIENGSQVPSRQTFRLLMERLGEPGYTYAHFQSESEYKFYLTLSEFMEAIEQGEVEEMDEKLWFMQKVLRQGDPVMKQAYEMARVIWYHRCGLDCSGYADRCLRIFFLRRTGCRLVEDLPHMALDQIEMWVVNNIAVGFLWQKQPMQALVLLLHLYQRARRMPRGVRSVGKMRGILCNNLSLCFMEMGRYQEADRYCNLGLTASRYEGGIFLEMQLLRLKMEISKAEGRLASYQEQKSLFYTILSVFPRISQEETPEDLLWQSKEILIL